MSWSQNYSATSQADLATKTQAAVEQGSGAIPASVGTAITTGAQDIPVPDGKVLTVVTFGHFDHGSGPNYNFSISVTLADAPG